MKKSKFRAWGSFALAALLFGSAAHSQNSISGNVRRENGAVVAGVPMNLSGSATASQLTDAAGNYEFANLPTGGDYTITPSRENGEEQCVTVLDLLKIMRHIFGIEPLPSSYAIIQADANSNKGITTFDVVTLRKQILGIGPGLPNSPSWRFVPADYVFPNSQNPFGEIFPESSQALNLNANEQHDFIALKIGDVSGCNDIQVSPFVTFAAPQITANCNTPVVLNVTANGFTNVTALQFSMSWDPAVLQFTEVQGFNLNGMGSFNFNMNNAAAGSLSVAWFENETNPVTLPGGTSLFQLVFTAVGQEGSSSPISFVQTPTAFQVVNSDLAVSSINYQNGNVTVHCITDSDGDGILDIADNCVGTPNPLQEDFDGDGMGNLCDPTLSVCSAIQALISVIQASGISSTLINTLVNKLEQAQTKFMNGNNNGAIGSLNGFIGQVNGQSGSGIPTPLAIQWVAIAQAIKDAIVGGNANCMTSEGRILPPGGIGSAGSAFSHPFELFPNPATNDLTLVFNRETTKETTLQFLDLLGKSVHSETLQPGSQSHRLWIEALPAGVYFLRVLNGGEPVWVERVVKK